VLRNGTLFTEQRERVDFVAALHRVCGARKAMLAEFQTVELVMQQHKRKTHFPIPLFERPLMLRPPQLNAPAVRGVNRRSFDVISEEKNAASIMGWERMNYPPPTAGDTSRLAERV